MIETTSAAQRASADLAVQRASADLAVQRASVDLAAQRASADLAAQRASADLLIDQDRLSEILGRQVRATRLRFKPGLSTTAVLLDASNGQGAPGWIQASHPAHLDKLRKAVELAQQRGQRVHLLEAGGLLIAHGTIDTDPRLQKGMDALRSVHPSITEAVETGGLTLLRYNPQRRIVLRRQQGPRDALVLRVTAGKQRDVSTALGALAAAGVPVVEPLVTHPLARSRRVSAWPWFGQGDLAETQPTVASDTPARAAGAALARLHGVGPSVSLHGVGPSVSLTEGAQPTPIDTPDLHGSLSALVQDLAALDSNAAGRLRTLVSEVAALVTDTSWVTGLIHGDFSADQVLVGRAGEELVRLTDFDRAAHGPLMADLGSFAAAELLATTAPDPSTTAQVEALPLTAALLQGYAETGGPARHQLDGRGVRTWTARALLGRVLEPFRAGDHDWVDGIHRRLDQASEVLA